MHSGNVIRTLRISCRLDEELRDLAEERGTSVNAIAEAELQKLVEFDRFADELEYTVVRKAWLTRLIAYLSEEEIREFGRWTGGGPGRESINFYQKRMDLDSVLKTYESIGSKYSRFFKFRHESDGAKHTIILNHGMGRNWSIYYDANLRKVFEDILGFELVTELGDNIIIGRFETIPKPISERGVASIEVARSA